VDADTDRLSSLETLFDNYLRVQFLTWHLLAVHISSGVLPPLWALAGYGAAALLVGVTTFRMSEDEFPRIAVLTAAFFVASSIRVPYVVSIHLLFNGLVGVILGSRCCLSIFVGTLLQAFLGHGALDTAGINATIMMIPALAASMLFRLGNAWRRKYFLGAILGGGAVLLTIVLNALTLWLGAGKDFAHVASIVALGHLPIALLEAIILGTTVEFLARVKPEILGIRQPPGN
jgi:cobalt/nickel transport system permease protein